MKLILEANIQNVILCSFVFIGSCWIILKALRKFKMHLASKLFSILASIIGIYIPFYFCGTLLTNVVASNSNPSYMMFFIKHQMEKLNAPFILFESASMLIGVIAVIAIIALIIATILFVKIVATSFAKARSVRNLNEDKSSDSVVSYYYVPDHSNTYLFLRHLLN